MTRLFKFDSLVTPSIIKFLFYLGVIGSIIGSVIGGLGIMGSGAAIMQYQSMLGLAYIVGGLILLIVGTLVGIVVSRVMAELILVLFMIRDELAWQRERSGAASAE